MNETDDPGVITTLEALTARFGAVSEAASRKEADHLPPVYQAVVRASPFYVLATLGPEGLDASPRGDRPGFVAIHDRKTLRLPERRGNNRIDSLRNIIADPRVALLFLVPGCGETLRVNGTARILTGPSVLAPFAVDGRLPTCVIEVTVETAFFQCARAIRRSRLWEPLPAEILESVPTAGAMLTALTEGAFDGESYDAELSQRQERTLY